MTNTSLHVGCEEKRQDVVVLGTEGQHHHGHGCLHVEGVQDHPVVAKAQEQMLAAQHQDLVRKQAGGLIGLLLSSEIAGTATGDKHATQNRAKSRLCTGREAPT